MEASSSSSQPCHMCRNQAASVYCTCMSPPSLLCPHCSFPHQTKSPLGLHFIRPIKWLNRDPEEYARAQRQLDQGKRELRGNIEVLREFSEEISHKVDGCIQWLYQYKDSWTKSVLKEKERLSLSIEAAIQEAEALLTSGSTPTSPLAQALFTLKPEELRVIRYSVTIPDFQSLSRTWITYRSYLQVLCERVSSLPSAQLLKTANTSLEQMRIADKPTVFAPSASVSMFPGPSQPSTAAFKPSFPPVTPSISPLSTPLFGCLAPFGSMHPTSLMETGPSVPPSQSQASATDNLPTVQTALFSAPLTASTSQPAAPRVASSEETHLSNSSAPTPSKPSPLFGLTSQSSAPASLFGSTVSNSLAPSLFPAQPLNPCQPLKGAKPPDGLQSGSLFKPGKSSLF